jgi:hypothetical protein
MTDFKKISDIVKEYCEENKSKFVSGIAGFYEDENYIGVMTGKDRCGPLDVLYDPENKRVKIGCFGEENGLALGLLWQIQTKTGLEGEVIEVDDVAYQIPQFPQKYTELSEKIRQHYIEEAERIVEGFANMPEEEKNRMKKMLEDLKNDKRTD